MVKRPVCARPRSNRPRNQMPALQLFVKIASRARDKDSARHVALAVLYALYDSRRFAALGAIRALRCVHHLLAVCCFRYLHLFFSSQNLPQAERLGDDFEYLGVILEAGPNSALPGKAEPPTL